MVYFVLLICGEYNWNILFARNFGEYFWGAPKVVPMGSNWSLKSVLIGAVSLCV